MVPLDLVTVVLLLGAAILSAAIYPISQLLTMTRSRSLRQYWIALAVLIAGFILGYLVLIWDLPRDLSAAQQLTICAVLFGGSIFVLAVSLLAARTAGDVARLVHLEHEVIVDPLTGAYNRRFFDQRLTEEVARAGRNGSELSLLVFDLDCFKQINDTHGHSAGDRVLGVVAATIASELRPNDILARFGGEEFVVISLLNSAASALQMAERLRAKVSDTQIQLAGGEPISVTVSVGVAALASGEDARALFDRADRAVFQAKERGRDKAVLAAPATDEDALKSATGRATASARGPGTGMP